MLSDFLAPLPASVPPPSGPVPPPPAGHADPAAEADRETAFSDEITWNGRKLHGFSIERYTAFLDFRTHIGAPRLAKTVPDGNAFLPDAIRILWFCSVESAVITSLRRDPDSMQEAIMRWAGTEVPLSRAKEAIVAGLHIFDSAYLSKHETVPSASPPPPSGNVHGPSGAHSMS